MPQYKYAPKDGHKLYNRLLSLTDDQLFHERHGAPLAHPADLVSEKLSEVSDLVVRLREDLSTGEPGARRSELTKSLVFAVNEFYDQLFLVMKCLTPPGEADALQQADVLRPLRERNAAALNKFYGPTKHEHGPMRELANVLKHQPSTIVHIEVDNHKGATAHGFFVQIVVGADDLRGPHRVIHPMYRAKVNTGISYNYLLLAVVARVFSYLDKLYAALFGAAAPPARRPLNQLDRLLAVV